MGLQEAELVQQVDTRLQRADIGQAVRVAVIVVLGEKPGIELVRGLLGELRDDRDRFLVVGRIEIEMPRAQRIFEEVDDRGAVLL